MGVGAGAASGSSATPPKLSRAGSRSSFAWSTNPIFKQAGGQSAGASPEPGSAGAADGTSASAHGPLHAHVTDLVPLARLLPEHVEEALAGTVPGAGALTPAQRTRLQALVEAAEVERCQHQHHYAQAQGKVLPVCVCVGCFFGCLGINTARFPLTT